MIEVLCIYEATQEKYRRLIPLGDILTVAEEPGTNAVLIVFNRKKRKGFRKIHSWVEVAETFDEVKKKMKNAMNPFADEEV